MYAIIQHTIGHTQCAYPPLHCPSHACHPTPQSMTATAPLNQQLLDSLNGLSESERRRLGAIDDWVSPCFSRSSFPCLPLTNSSIMPSSNLYQTASSYPWERPCLSMLKVLFMSSLQCFPVSLFFSSCTITSHAHFLVPTLHAYDFFF